MKISFLNQISCNNTNIIPNHYKNVQFTGREKAISTLSGSTLGMCLANYVIKPNNLNRKEEITLEDCLQSKISNNFNNYKKAVIKFFEKNNYKQYDQNDENIIKNLKNANNENDFNFELEMYLSRIISEMQYKEEDIIQNIEDATIKKELCNDIEIKTGNVAVNVLKLMQNRNTNLDVIEIKKEFNKKYKQDFVYLNNDIEFAKACKEVFKILEQNNIPLKQIDCIIASDYVDFGGICLNTDKGKAVIVNPNNWQVSDIGYTILHEILHTLQPDDINFRMQEIPDEFKETADNVSEYARNNFAHELHCELYVKKLTKGLNIAEEKLFNFLGGSFL